MRTIERTLFLGAAPALLLAAGLTGCTSDHSPNIYASNAVQQVNKVDAGVVIGFREVMISANGTAGAVTGGAAGGVLGTTVGGSTFDQALGGVAGSAIGSALGSTIEHVTGDTKGWEYIVRKTNNDLISVTQIDPIPLPLGQKVLVIGGAQARIVADYSVDLPHEKVAEKPPEKREEKPAEKITEAAPEHPMASSTMPPADKPTVSELPPPPPAAEPAATELPEATPLLPINAPD